MKVGKILGGVVLAAVAVIAVVVFLGLQNLDQIIKVAVETVGPRVTGTAVTLDSVKLEITNGRGELHGLQIDNPKGYNSEYAFYLGEIALQVDPKSLTGDVVVINEILVDGAKLIAEQKDLKQFNLQDLMDNMSQGSKQPAANEKPADSSGASDIRLIIEKISFTNNDANLISSKWGEKTLKIPDINLTDIGKKENGLSPEQLGPAIFQPLLKQAERAVKKELESLAREKAEDKLNKKMDEKLNDEQKEQVKGLKKLFK